MKRNNFYILLLSVTICLNTYSQNIDPVIIATLPPEIYEGSGIEYNNSESIWIHNDSDDGPVLYKINMQAVLLDELYMYDLYHFDYEDITQDEAGNYYIGDFGNNFSNREDLVIYKIPDPDSITNPEFNYEEIHFSYNDQLEIPSPPDQMNYDCESIFYFNDSLYIFSKNHSASSYTRMYKMPAVGGEYDLSVIDSFDTGGWITAADISPEENRVVLLSEEYFWIFYEFENGDFFKGKNKKISMTKTQKEGVVFINNDEILIIDEGFMNPSYLYHINIDSLINPVYEIENRNPVNIYPNPSDSSFKLTFKNRFSEAFELIIYNNKGDKVKSIQNIKGEQLDCKLQLLPGIYYYQLVGKKENYKGKFVIK